MLVQEGEYDDESIGWVVGLGRLGSGESRNVPEWGWSAVQLVQYEEVLFFQVSRTRVREMLSGVC